jgi:hypothetical protein
MFELIEDSDPKYTWRFFLILAALFFFGVTSVFCDNYLHHSFMEVIYFPACLWIGCRGWSKRMNRYHASHLWLVLSIIITLLAGASSWIHWAAPFILSLGSLAIMIQLESVLKHRSRKSAEMGEAQL